MGDKTDVLPQFLVGWARVKRNPTYKLRQFVGSRSDRVEKVFGRLGGTETEPNLCVGFRYTEPDLQENGEGIVQKTGFLHKTVGPETRLGKNRVSSLLRNPTHCRSANHLT